MRILEIGPSYAPLAPRSEGWNVCTADHATREELMAKYADPTHAVDVDRIEEVDVVWRTGSLATAVGEPRFGFDVCLASHVIEHTPDLVAFLTSVMRMLAPHGRLSLAVPDLRYCFDLLRGPTRIGEIVDAHVAGATRHTLATLVGHEVYAVRKNERIAWDQTEVGPIALLTPLDHARSHLERAQGEPAELEYFDAHAWRFTPASFQLTILELAALGLVDAHISSIHETVGCEFFASVAHGAPALAPEELDALRLALLHQSIREVGEAWMSVES